MLLVSLISYVDRNTLALLAPTVLDETGLSQQQYGWVISAFSVMYMLGNPAWGLVLDRYGLRAGMTAAVAFWTAASAAHAFVSTFGGFALARALLGFGEGATFPGGLRTVVQTLPVHQRARGLAVAYSGGSLGAIVTPLLVMPVAAAYGWRGAFLATGLVGGAWLLLWAWISRRPELRHLPPPAGAAPEPGWWRRRSLWAFLSAYALGALPLAFVLYGAALYLGRGRGQTQEWIGSVLWIPPLGWEAGYFAWGWVSDRFVRTTRDAARWLLLPAAGSLPLALLPHAPTVEAVLALMFLSMFAAAGFIVLSLGYATRTLGAGRAGLVAGLGAGAWSALVAIIMPVMGRLFDAREYGVAFALAAGFPLAGYGLWRWLAG